MILIGTVTDAKGYVSEDKSAAYSEYAVSVTEVLKGADKLTSTFNYRRTRGRKDCPARWQKIPVLGNEAGNATDRTSILAFLKDTPEGKDYFVLTGYELSKGRVSPLDGISGKYEQFDGQEESAFIEMVRSNVK